jgi:hypothetical protein
MGSRSKQQQKRGLLQIRDQRSGDGRWWSPNRDITVVYPGLLRQVFQLLSQPEEDWPESWRAIKQRMGITEEELGNAARMFAKIIVCVIKRGEDLQSAIETSGFCAHRVYALVGAVALEQFTTLFCSKYGETLHRGEHDPNQKDLKECLAMLEAFAEQPCNDGEASDSRG